MRVSLICCVALLLGLGPVLRAQAPPRPDLITPQAEAAIAKGVAYLVRTQGASGAWGEGDANRRTYQVTMTSLGGLALMAAGNTPTTGPQADNVARAVEYVLACSSDGGLIASPTEGQTMYGHGFAMLFLAHAYGMEADPLRQKRLAQVLERAVRLTAASQSRDGGWYYTPESQNDEGSVTVTQIQGLRACRDAGIPVSPRTIQRACEYIFKCANSDGGISYALRSRGSSLPAITAAAVSTMYNGGVFEHPVAHGALKFCKQRIAASNGDAARAFQGHVYYSLLYLGQAMWFSGDADWNAFFPPVREFFLKQQAGDGSWNGDGVGTTFGTSIALLTLQLPYSHLPLLQR